MIPKDENPEKPYCGAVVASEIPGLIWEALYCCFNPLHCGAVVASRRSGRGGTCRTGVLIPFIAGQWSLRHRVWVLFAIEGWFQSPSLRGSGRFF